MRMDRTWVAGVFGLMLGLCVACGWGGIRAATTQAQAASTPPEPTAGTIAFTSGTGPTQFLYLIDTKSQALAVYRVDPQNPKGSLKLEAARQYRWDLKLAEYNNLPPEVSAIESMVSGPVPR
jgi:hypothetical protein